MMKSAISMLLIILAVQVSNAGNPDEKINIVFRFDDYQLKSSEFYDSLFNIFKKNKIPLCLGIIPFDENGVIHNELNQEQMGNLNMRIGNGELEIALHGLDHTDNGLRKGSFLIKPVPSEFALSEFNLQLERISRSKKTLDSLLNTNVNIFIPPFNTYDDNTLKALDSLKFEIISASLSGTSGSHKIKYMPFTVNDLNELPEVVRKNQESDASIIIVMHSYSFKEGSDYTGGVSKRITLKQLDSLLNWINNQGNINSTSFSTLNKNEIFDFKRFGLNSLDKNLIIKILNRLKYYRYGGLNTTEYEKHIRWIFILLNTLLHVLSFISIYIISKTITRKLNPSRILLIAITAIIFLFVLLFLYSSIYSHSFIMRAVYIGTISTSLVVGLFAGRKMSNKNIIS